MCARHNTASQLRRFPFGIALYGRGILSSILPLYFATAAAGRAAGLAPAGGAAVALVVKNVVIVHVPLTVVLGRTGYADLPSPKPSNFKSPTLIIRDRRLRREKKSTML